MTAHRRRRVLVPSTGLEVFEARVVLWLDGEGDAYTSAEVTCPDGNPLPSLAEVLGSLEISKTIIVGLYESG